MAEMKRLAKETAIYGVSSILGRFLNWLLVPFYSYVLGSTKEFGIVSNVYAWTALLMVLLTYGMETGFFRFANKTENKAEHVYTTALVSLGITSIVFILLITFFLQPIAFALKFEGHGDYLWMMAFTVAIDAFCTIPFAWLRYKQRPIYFASVRIFMIGVNIFFNVFFLWACPLIQHAQPQLIDWFYNPEYRVGYVFVSNVISVLAGLTLLAPQFVKIKWTFSFTLFKEIIRYSFPLMLLGIAGIMNQSLDKMILPYLYDNFDVGQAQLGIYSACFKLGLVMMMFTQAFRYAYEPFVFSKQKEIDSKESYREGMSYFLIFSVFVFLGVMFFMDIIKLLLKNEYREGLFIVPIVLLCYIFQGIMFNLSFWYKLTDKTKWGAYISFIGLVITVVGNVLFVPIFGYVASAWSAFICYLVMMLASWWLGKKYYPINYDLKLAGRYLFVGALLYAIGMLVPISNIYARLAFRTLLLVLFAGYVFWKDIPMGVLSFLNRHKP